MKGTKIFGVGLLVGVFASATAYAVPISPGGAFAVGSSPIYVGGVWNQPSTLNSGSVKNESGVGNRYMMKGTDAVTFNWTGNPLNLDLSSGGLAEGAFSSGGVIEVFGKLRNAAFPNALVFDGLLLKANVGSFQLRETDVNSNIINSIGATIQLTPFDGYLYTNSTLQLNGTYEFAVIGAVTGPMSGGNLNDFQTDLVSLQAFQINYNLVPEASSVLLLGCGLFVMGIRKSSHLGDVFGSTTKGSAKE